MFMSVGEGVKSVYFDDRYKRWANQISKYYPRPKPCTQCEYWVGNSNRTEKRKGYNTLPHCNYLSVTGITRNCYPDMEAGTCDCFKKRSKAKKKPNKNY